MTHKIAIVGAGLAGLSCARVLRRAGFWVEVFEQEGSIGGRIATTRIGGDRFDHGAQYLAPQSADFRSYIEDIAALGYAERWLPRVALNGTCATPQDAWFVGTPGMSAIARPLAETVAVAVGRRVQGLERRQSGWHVWFEDEMSAGPFDAVAVAIPAAQAVHLWGFDELGFAASVSAVRMLPCWALMVRVEAKKLAAQDVLANASTVIRWIARDNAKPGRDPRGETLVVHASADWSLAAEDADPVEVAETLWSDVSDVLDLPPVRPTRMTAHLWRQGVVARPLGRTHLYCPETKVGLAGDWCLGNRAEHAFESGGQLGKAIIASLR